GIMAMELALRRPEVVQGLVLIGTAARPRGSHPPISLMDNVLTGVAGVLNWVVPGWWGAIALGQKSLFRYLICNHTPQTYHYLAKQGAPAFLRTSRHAESALFRAIRAGYNRVPDLKELSMPSLMLCGECDRHITAESSLETARALPTCDVHCYPQTAHLFPWEIPEQMTADLRNWLDEQSVVPCLQPQGQ
ncbi:MAG: alpha/beta hydrolase, partial [Cyanobacteria bacterium J06632_3]